MRIDRCSRLAIFFLLGSCVSALPAQQGASVAAPDGSAAALAVPPEAPPHGVEPQIVRVSLLQGDVRVSRGKGDAKITGAMWEQAAPDLPLESGFDLVTGRGRAEIEFEDASTVYLAENSALRFNDLTTKDGVPHTDFILLAGTMTLHLQPTFPGESYVVQTPTYKAKMSYPGHVYDRLSSYVDGVQLTALEKSSISVNNHLQQMQGGVSTLVLDQGGSSLRRTARPDPASAAWDAWVADRLNARSTAMKAVMQEAGVTTPLPGMADMAGQGTFFDCPPYGKCWAPANGWTRPLSDSPAASNADQVSISSQAPADATLQEVSVAPGSMTLLQKKQAVFNGADDPYYDDFPCWPWGWHRDLYRQAVFQDFYPYTWTVCHTGSWIVRGRGYVWVAGTRRHHHCPVRWVKYGGKLAYVPRHPLDRPGRPPENLKHGVYSLGGEKGRVERIAFDPRTSLRTLDQAPKEFQSLPLPTLRPAEPPQVEAHLVHEPLHMPTAAGGKAAGPSAPSREMHLAFDHKSQGFVLAGRVSDGSHTSTFNQHFGGNGGSFQNGGFSRGSGQMAFAGGGGGYSGGRSTGGEGGRGSFSGGGSSSGVSHGGYSGGGGGASGSGGASHGGGGGGVPSGGGGGVAGGSSSTSSGGASHR